MSTAEEVRAGGWFKMAVVCSVAAGWVQVGTAGDKMSASVASQGVFRWLVPVGFQGVFGLSFFF